MQSSLMFLQTTPSSETSQTAQPLLPWVQVGLVVLLLAGIGGIAFLMIHTGVGSRTLPKDERSWLDYGNLYVVALGIGAVTTGFLVILLFLDQFSDRDQALGFLTALIGAIVGLVGTYFGVKNSSDAREGVEQIALTSGTASTAPSITITPATAPADPAAPLATTSQHTLTATVTSIDGSPAANIAVTFTVTTGPDAGQMSVDVTDQFGQARFTLVNNGAAGTDTIEAAALGGSGTATATFT